ncbi:MAG: NINE protein, partial [Xenococcaceae cyanobacterium]
MQKKETGTAYVLCAIGLFVPIGGLHRFYLNRSGMGLLYLLTGGLFYVGTFVDLFLIPQMVNEENRKN